MKFGLKNLGPIKDADIELGDLTIICGKNNCGKTYLTHSLYSFLATIQRSFVFQINEINAQYFDDCYKDAACSINTALIWEKFNTRLVDAMKNFKEEIPFFLTISPSALHNDLTISAIMEDCDYNKFKEIQRIAKFQVTEKCIIHVSKNAQSANLDINIENTGERLPRKENLRKMFNVVCSIFLNQIFPDAFSLTGERSGISLFADSIAEFSRKMENLSLPISKIKRRIQIVKETGGSNQSFPLPVEKEVAFFQNLRKIRKRASYISKEHPELLVLADQLSGGHYNFDDQLGIQYIPENTEVSLTLSECSSSVKSLVEFNFYLRHCAKKDQILMIDEPELNLHPANQRKLARLLAQLVNVGMRVFITTHSDYIIREFNTLIQLKQDKMYIAKIKEAEGYTDSELLDVSRIRAYVAKQHDDGVVFEKAPITQEAGITISTLDDVIDKMNQIQDAIIWGGEDHV